MSEPGSSTNVTSETEGKPDPEGPLGSASFTEILLPPFLLAAFCLLALAVLYVALHPKKLRGFFCRADRYREKTSVSFHNDDFTPSVASSPAFSSTSKFLTERDVRILEKLPDFQSNFPALLLLATPPLLSLVFCPVALFMHKPILDYFWPTDIFPVVPDLNSPIACFLVPSGMVYAISFGFAFQEAVGKFQLIDAKISDKISITQQLVSMVCKMTGLSPHRKIKIFLVLKAELINKILQIQHQFSEMEEVDIWGVLEHLQYNQPTLSKNLELVVYDEIMRCLRKIHSLSASPEPIHKRMPVIQWVLLETLSYFTFLGILLIQADSYRMELAMCIITVVSITLLCDAVSDVDSPFHGLFRIELTSLSDTVRLLEKTAEKLLSNDGSQ